MAFSNKLVPLLWEKKGLVSSVNMIGVRYTETGPRSFIYIKKRVGPEWTLVALYISLDLRLFSLFHLNCSYIQYFASCLKDNFSVTKDFYHLFHIFLVFVVVSHNILYQKLLIIQQRCLEKLPREDRRNSCNFWFIWKYSCFCW